MWRVYQFGEMIHFLLVNTLYFLKDLALLYRPRHSIGSGLIMI